MTTTRDNWFRVITLAILAIVIWRVILNVQAVQANSREIEQLWKAVQQK